MREMESKTPSVPLRRQSKTLLATLDPSCRVRDPAAAHRRFAQAVRLMSRTNAMSSMPKGYLRCWP